MHADVKGALNYLNNNPPHQKLHFEHKGKEMKNYEVRKVLEYALAKGYKTTAELSDEEVDSVLQNSYSNT
jgi:hypothetical protein